MTALDRALASRHAALITHACLALLTAAMFALLWWTPLAFAILPCAVLHHRIGILVHEYIHGIPFHGYRRNLAVVTFYDGLLLSFGFLELFRATHLAHHRWLNSRRDPAHQAARGGAAPRSRVVRALWALEAPQHVRFMFQALAGRVPIIKPTRVVAGAVQSAAWIAVWIAVGRPDVVLGLAILAAVTTLLSSSLRGAVEHHGPPGSAHATNEYRPLLPLFNMNRHAHHHASPTTPWYRLRYQTASPLPRRCFVTYWFHVYVTRRYALLPEDR